MTKAVLFDFDGTLYFGTQALNAWCFEEALRAMGRPAPTEEKLNRTVGMTPDAFSRLILDSDDPALIAEFMDRVYALVPEYIAHHVHPSAEARKMLEALRGKAKLAVCSNAHADYLLPMLDALGMREYFDFVWHVHEGVTKAQAIPKVMRELGADYAVFCGDRLEDVESARAAGIPVAGIRNAAYPWEVDGADNVAENHAQLRVNIEKLLSQEEGTDL